MRPIVHVAYTHSRRHVPLRDEVREDVIERLRGIRRPVDDCLEHMAVVHNPEGPERPRVRVEAEGLRSRVGLRQERGEHMHRLSTL